jgi:hypothetical protein
MTDKINALLMERQHLTRKADEAEYTALYRDLQPGLNVYWNGFGDPPSLTFRADFDDIEFNRERQRTRTLIKLRLTGGNLGWIVPEDLELFAAIYRKPLDKPTPRQLEMLDLIEREGPLTIQLIKENTGMLVKEITPVLHRLQEAFLIYEDQYDGEWDRAWYRFGEMFPNADFAKFTRAEALKMLLTRFAFRQVLFDLEMAKSYFKLPAKELKSSISELLTDGLLVETERGYLSESELLKTYSGAVPKAVYAMHRNDFLVKSNKHWLEERFKHPTHETLHYLLIDGKFRGAVVGHFRNGPYDLEDVILDLPPTEAAVRKPEILDAVRDVNHGRTVSLYLGKEV